VDTIDCPKMLVSSYFDENRQYIIFRCTGNKGHFGKHQAENPHDSVVVEFGGDVAEDCDCLDCTGEVNV